MDKNEAFVTVQDIYKKYSNRKIVLFGAGPIAEKTFRKLVDFEIEFIVDNAPNLWGLKELNLDVRNPNDLIGRKDLYVIICTTSYEQVSAQLLSLGFDARTDFCVSPVLNDLMIIDSLQNIEAKLLFSSGSPTSEDPSSGGGLYELQVSKDAWSHKKIFSGNCYGIVRFGENFISIDQEIGIFEFNNNYEILRSQELPAGLRGHGLRVSEKYERIYIVGSYIDAILVLDFNFKVIDQINISHKKGRHGTPKHHCNDCLVIDDSLYVSMFSYTGNWQNDAFDGCVLEIDLDTQKITGIVKDNLWMPHNIDMINGSLHILNSLPGEMLTNNFSVIGKFPAFTRGLAHDGIFYYIGQSRNRNFSKNIGISDNISIDSGIIVFDDQTKVSRFLQLHPKLSEIHHILMLD